MTTNHSLILPTVLASLLVVFAASLAACGGSATPTAKPGPLVCDILASGSYRYTVSAVLTVTALPNSPSSSPAPSAFAQPHPLLNFSWDIQGSVQGPAIDATMHIDTGSSKSDYEAIMLADNRGFLKLGTSWTESDTSKRPLPVPYQPSQLCTALAPDVDTAKLGAGQPETVNGVSSQKFTLQGLPTSFFANEPDFGSGSDVAVNVKTLDGTIWVADSGNYPTKLDIIGAGQYSNGQPISVKMTFELSDVGGDITIGAPQ